jgi:hypothetical protein
MNISRVDKIIQYALLVASEEDDFRDRQLGPIHLIKYVYLADLAYSKKHEGNTFTGVKWQFYKFGPWAQEVNQRIEPALLCIDTDKKTFPSNYGDRDEWVRWRAIDDTPIADIERELPFVVISNVRRFVHRFGQSTPDLLAYVYSTEPMLSAAPSEYLNFKSLSKNKEENEPEKEHKAPLSKKKQKLLKAKMRELKSLSKKKLDDRRKNALVKPPITPRYDKVYFEGVEWLDSLAGTALDEGDKEAVFSNSIWKSPARRGDNVPG